MPFIMLIILGGVAGYIATRTMGVSADALSTIIIGMLGAFLGGFLLLFTAAFLGLFGPLLGAIVGSMIVIRLWKSQGT